MKYFSNGDDKLTQVIRNNVVSWFLFWKYIVNPQGKIGKC